MIPRLSYALLSLLLVHSPFEFTQAQDSPSVETDSTSNPVALIKMALRAASLENAYETTKYFYEGLESLGDNTYADSLHTDVIDIMTSDERKAYKNADDKGLALLRFWQSQDPTPATFANERIVEHYQRLEYARRWYTSLEYRGYDDRGMIYVKFGPPEEQIKTEAHPFLYDNECWVYKRYGLEIVYDFISKIGRYELMPPDRFNIGPMASIPKYSVKHLYEFTQIRSNISYAYMGISSEIYAINTHRRIMGREKIPPDLLKIEKNLERMYRENRTKESELPQITTELTRPEKSLDGVAIALARFFPEQSPLLEMYLGVSCSKLIPDRYSNAHLHIDYAVRDSNYAIVLRNSLRRTVPVSAEPSQRKGIFIDQLNESLPPGQYSVAMEIKNPEANTCYENTYKFSIPGISPDTLILSDIELAYSVEPKTEYTGNRSFIKGDYAVTPYPYSVLKRNRPVFVYFEVYNLLFSDSGYTLYEVEYEVRSTGKGLFRKINPFSKSVAQSSSYELHGEKKDTQEYFSLNLEKMKPGDYSLKVRVTDRVSGKTQESTVTFGIIE